MTEPFALEGEIITCDGGHELYRLSRDVICGERIKASQFTPIDKEAQQPVDGDEMLPCPKCGEAWFRGRFHFKDGWR